MPKFIKILIFVAYLLPVLSSGSEYNTNPRIELKDLQVGPEYDAKRVDHLLSLLIAANEGRIDELIELLENDLASASINFSSWDPLGSDNAYYQKVKQRLKEYRNRYGSK